MADKKKRSLIRKIWESIVNTALLWPRTILATTTFAGQLLRNFLATDVNGWQSLSYKQTIKNYGKKLSYALSAPVTAFSPKLKQKRGPLDKVPGPKERNKDTVRCAYMGMTSGRISKYTAQLAIDAWLLWSEWLESMLYLDKESPMYTGPWPTITQKLKNFGKSIIMPFEPIFRRSQNKLWLFGGKKKAKVEAKKPEENKKVEIPVVETKKPEEVKKVEVPKVAKVAEGKKDKPVENPQTESDLFQKKIEEKDDKFLDEELAERWYGPGGKLSEESKPESKPEKPASKLSDTPPKTIDEIKKNNKAVAEKKDKDEQDQKKWKNLDPKFKVEYGKEYKKMLNGKVSKDWVIQRWIKNNKGKTIKEITTTLKKDDNIQFASYIEDEILDKAA